ncbi:MAG: DUF4411 family protein [Candidatus Margulisbacteria bacterium]|nr:DUF4411 family protein [Candidatus Margulisiibacteriota bacterium]
MSITNSIYVFDTCTLSNIFNHYYSARFPTFWAKFDLMLKTKRITSVREVKNELALMNHIVMLDDWLKTNKDSFPAPTPDELSFITKIYSVKHFQQNLERKKLLHGGPFADPFVIARAKSINGTVVTEEKNKKNGRNIPNICEHFKIPCINFEDFLRRENWTF